MIGSITGCPNKVWRKTFCRKTRKLSKKNLKNILKLGHLVGSAKIAKKILFAKVQILNLDKQLKKFKTSRKKHALENLKKLSK